MEKSKKWLDIESREIVTAKQLYDEYIDNMEDGTCDACTFDEYVINCLTINNGTLIEITDEIPTVAEYRNFNPYTESLILCDDNDTVLVIDRYDVNDYSIWTTDRRHLYDDTYGFSTRGDFESILADIKEKTV